MEIQTEIERPFKRLKEAPGMKRILVTQSERETAQTATYALMEQGFQVGKVYNVEEALQKIKSQLWDLAILDIRTSAGDGFSTCQRVREHTIIPIIMLSELGEDEYIVKGLNAGADDYLVKPISGKVLVARVYALLRRAGRMREGMQSGVFRQGDLVIDFDRHEVSVRGQPVYLTVTEFWLLSYLPLVFLLHCFLFEFWSYQLLFQD